MAESSIRKKRHPTRKELTLDILCEAGILPGSAEYDEYLQMDEYQQRFFVFTCYQKIYKNSEYAYSTGKTDCNMDGVRAESVQQFYPSAMARSSLLYLQSIAIMHTPATHYTHRKDYASYLLLETLSGEGVFTCGGITRLIFPGDIILLDCRTEHYYAARTAWNYRILHFNGVSMATLYQLVATKRHFYFDAATTNTIRALIDQIYHCCLQNTDYTELICNKLLVDCITDLLLLCPDHRKEQPEWIAAVCRYLDSDFQPNILARLEDKFYRNRYYIAHAFKEFTGQTVLQYQTRAKMDAATHMLLDTDLTIDEISVIIGYENTSSFNKAFRKHFGISPGLFRRQTNH